MKKIILSALVLTLAFAVQAQEGKPRGDKAKHHKGDVMEKLDLSADQKAKLKTEQETYRMQMQELKNASVPDTEKKEKMQNIRKEHNDRVQGILTADQRSKLAKIKAEHKATSMGDKKEKAEHMKDRGDRDHNKGHRDHDRKDDMKEKLNLTADQEAKMKQSNMEMKEKMKAIRENDSLDEAAKKEKMKELMTERKAYMKQILTEEQMKKLEEGRKEGQYKEKSKNKPSIK